MQRHNYWEMVLTPVAARRSIHGTRIAQGPMMLFLPDSDYETDPWGGVGSSASPEIACGGPEVSDSNATRSTVDDAGGTNEKVASCTPEAGRFQLLRGQR